MKRAIGLAALTVLELPHEEQVNVAAQAGYSHVGLRLVPVAGQPHQHPLDMPALEKRLADTGVRVLDVEVFRLTPDTRVDDWEPILADTAWSILNGPIVAIIPAASKGIGPLRPDVSRGREPCGIS